MSIGGSIFLVALGAILYFATNFSVSGFEISTAGLILMIAGAIGLVVSLLATQRRTRSTVVVDDGTGAGPVTRTESRSDTTPPV